MFVRNRIDMALTNLVTAFPDQDDKIIEFFLPSVPTDRTSGLFYAWSKSRDLELLQTTPLGDDDKVPEKIVVLDADKRYQCQPYAVQAPAGRISTQDAAPQLNWAQRLALAAARSLSLTLRFDAVNNTLRNSNKVPTATYPAGRRWDNTSSPDSQPLVDLEHYVNQVARDCGRRPNRVGFVRETFTALKNHPDTLDRLKYTQNGAVLSKDKLCEILDIPQGSVEVFDAQYRSSRDGQSAAYRKYLGSDVLIAYVEPPSLENSGFGFTFAFGGFSPQRIAIINAYDQMRGALGTDYQRAVSIADFNIANPDAGLRLAGVVNPADSRYGGYLD